MAKIKAYNLRGKKFRVKKLEYNGAKYIMKESDTNGICKINRYSLNIVIQ